MNTENYLEKLRSILGANGMTMSGITSTKQLVYNETKDPFEYGLINLLVTDDSDSEVEIAEVVLKVFPECNETFKSLIDEDDEGMVKLYEGLDLDGEFIPEVVTLLSNNGKLIQLEHIEVAENFRNIGIATNLINMLPNLIKDLFGNMEYVLALNALAVDCEDEEAFFEECTHLSEYFDSLGFEIGTDEFTLYKII